VGVVRLRGKTGGGERLTHTMWTGGRGYPRRWKWIGDERFVTVCEWEG